MICMFSVHVINKFLLKIIVPYFGYQLNSCKFYVGLTYFMIGMGASTHSGISLCFSLSSFW
jgi:hypothetical protein